MNPFLIDLILKSLLGAQANEFIALAQRLILEAEATGESGEEKARRVLTALAEWAAQRGLLTQFPPNLREAILRLAVEVMVFFLSRQGLINGHKRDFYEQKAFPWG